MTVVTKNPSGLGIVIEGLDARAIDAAEAAALRERIHHEKLVVLKGQQLSREEYVAFGRVMGRPQVYFQPNYHHPEHPEIFVSSNVPENGQKVGVAGTGKFWHSDYQFFDEPLSITTVYPQVLPSHPRETIYLDMERVLENLGASWRKRLEGLWAFHEATWYYKIRPADIDRPVLDLVEEFRRESPGALHPMIIEHPTLGYEALYVSEGFTTGVAGMPYEESRRFLRELMVAIDRPQACHHQTWELGDLYLWDNRGLIHRAGFVPSQEPTVSYRVGVYEDLPFYKDPGPRPDGGPDLGLETTPQGILR